MGREDPLEEEMVIHSSILAWKILWIEEFGGLQSLGLQRLEHDLVTEHKVSGAQHSDSVLFCRLYSIMGYYKVLSKY